MTVSKPACIYAESKLMQEHVVILNNSKHANVLNIIGSSGWRLHDYAAADV
jgi:hypothetical protein